MQLLKLFTNDILATRRMKSKLKALKILLRKHIIEFSILLMCSVLGIIFWSMNSLRIEIHKTTAIQMAGIYLDAFEGLRKVYSSQVAARALSKGLVVTHDYLQAEGALPLPITFSRDWAKEIASNGKGVEARVYSDFPFSFNRDGGPKDIFEENALKSLRLDPTKPVFEFDKSSDVWRLRYARADRMQASCVECHNNHPQSPKKDWQVGDVRGALEVTIPMNAASFEGMKIFREKVLFIIIISGLIFSLIYSTLKWLFTDQ